jgi:DnaJ-class molecular chaperone
MNAFLQSFSAVYLKCNVQCFYEAKEKFQQLQKVISILGDTEKRALYDETDISDDDVRTSFIALQF